MGLAVDAAAHLVVADEPAVAAEPLGEREAVLRAVRGVVDRGDAEVSLPHCAGGTREDEDGDRREGAHGDESAHIFSLPGSRSDAGATPFQRGVASGGIQAGRR
jgi:hypothetical protein